MLTFGWTTIAERGVARVTWSILEFYIAVLDRVHFVQGEGEVLGVFLPHFHNGKCHCVVDGEMFPIRMRKVDNVSVRHTYRWKPRFMGLLAIYSVQDRSCDLWKISKNVTIVLQNFRPAQQNCRRNMHIHEWTLRRISPPRTATHARCSPPLRGPVHKLLWADLLPNVLA